MAKFSDFSKATVISIMSGVVVVVLVASWWVSPHFPKAPIFGMIAAFLLVFASIAWATIQGADDADGKSNSVPSSKGGQGEGET